MANHKQHLTFSTISGLIFGGLAWYPCGFPAVNCLLAGGLCSVGGLLPDIDIKTSRSFQDCMSITACIASMLIIIRVNMMGVSAEMVSIIGAVVFLAIKFGIGGILQSFTVHRGLIHSIPFGILCGEIVFLVAAGDSTSRVLKASGLTLGFFSHLLLDEIYSLKVKDGRLSIKKSFGTALKLGQLKNMQLTIILYFLLLGATYISFNQPTMVGSALDGVLDRVAGWTIRSAEYFETVSQQAQQHLRENSHFRNTLPNIIAEQRLESDETQIAAAIVTEQEKQEQHIARRQDRYQTTDSDIVPNWSDVSNMPVISSVPTPSNTPIIPSVPTPSNMPAISNGPASGTATLANQAYQPNTTSPPPFLIRRGNADQGNNIDTGQSNTLQNIPQPAQRSGSQAPPFLIGQGSTSHGNMTQYGESQTNRFGVAGQLPPAAPIQ